MRTILSAIALAMATGCLAPQSSSVATADIATQQAAPQITLAPVWSASELAGATYCTANNPVEIDGTQVCIEINHTLPLTYSLTTDYLWERGTLQSDTTAGIISLYPTDRTDLILAPDSGAPYTIEAYYMGDNLLLVTPTVTLQLNLVNP